MIIYYKQISEGYDDRERFVILQKVGMSSREVKKTITSQILLVFFLPILFAIVHICFAFDTIRKILFMLNLSNAWIFAGGTAAVVAAFILGYAIVYRLTARAYYRIVQS
jgi:putative ABC transport system permease protein